MKNSRFLGKAAAKAALNILSVLFYMIFTVRFSLKLSNPYPEPGRQASIL